MPPSSSAPSSSPAPPPRAATIEDAQVDEIYRKHPNARVLEVKHDIQREPWPSERVRACLERLVERVMGFDASVSDFTVRKECIKVREECKADDEDILEFYRRHPQLYWMATDRKMMAEKRIRDALQALLLLRARIESGELAEGRDAEAAATRAVLAALGTGHVADAPAQ